MLLYYVLFVWAVRPSQQFFSHVRTEPPLPGYYQYFLESRCILLKDITRRPEWWSNPDLSFGSPTLYHLATLQPFWGIDDVEHFSYFFHKNIFNPICLQLVIFLHIKEDNYVKNFRNIQIVFLLKFRHGTNLGPLRKHAHVTYSDFYECKKWKISEEEIDILLIFAQKVDGMYPIEPPCRSGSTSTHNQCFRAKIRKICIPL